MKEMAIMNPKGHVKIELYNEDGVFYTKEKKNQIVLDANKIIADMMANPTKTARLTKIDKGNTPLLPNEDNLYVFNLSIQPQETKIVQQDISDSNTEQEIQLNGVTKITKLLSVKVNDTDLVINQDVQIRDAEKGILVFKTAPTAPIEVKFKTVKNPMYTLIEGTEKVTVNGEVWTRADVPDDDNKTYSIDYELGQIFFENTKINIEVTFDYLVKYALGFMAIGGKPEGHPDFKPVSYSNADKLKPDMPEEFVDGRVPILFPCEVSDGDPNIDIFPTKPMDLETLTATFTTTDSETVYDIDDSGKKLIELVSVQNITDPQSPIDLVIGTDVTINDANTGKIALASAPAPNTTYKVVYKVLANNDHLIYQLTESPVVELISVKHTDASTGAVTNYDVQQKGLKLNQGDVWLLNPNAGIIQFSSNPSTGVTVNTPGQLTIEYRVNAGRVVKFVADFPKGVPGPVKTDATETFIVNGSTTFQLSHSVMKDQAGNFIVASVTVNGNPATYNLHTDGLTLDVMGANNGDTVVVKYSYLNDKHDIYQVAMFDGLDRNNSRMFNISGIGPITKDSNTGMRVTWSVTF